MVNIEIDASQMQKLQATVGRLHKGIPRVLAPAINRALAHGKTIVSRQIRKEYLIQNKDIPMTVERATYGSLHGAVVVKQGMLDLNKFRILPKVITRVQAFGVYAKVKKKGGANMPGAFLARMQRSGYRGPFIRAAGAKRLPIHKLITVGASIMASQPQIGPIVSKEMGDTLAKRIDHEIERVMTTGGDK
jgi:hypothetical protein